MSSTYNGNPASYPTSITIPSDGDGPGIKAADVNTAFEPLADRTAYLYAFLAAGFPHPVRVGNVADMQAVASANEGDLFLAVDDPPSPNLYRPKAQLYYWDPQINIGNTVGPDEPFVYQSAASVDYGPGLGLTGAWILVRPGYDISHRASISGTGSTTITSGAGYTDLTLSGPVDFEVTLPYVYIGDIIRVRAVVGISNGDRSAGYRCVYNDTVTDFNVPGTEIGMPNVNEGVSVTMVGEYVAASTRQNATVRVQGIKDIGSGSGDITVAGTCVLFVDVVRP